MANILPATGVAPASQNLFIRIHIHIHIFFFLYKRSPAMASSSGQSQYEKETGTTMEHDLAAILDSQVKSEAPQPPKRKEPPAATESVQAESINSSAPQTCLLYTSDAADE